MQLRQWYSQQEYEQWKFTLEHMKGTTIPIDGGTNFGSKSFHREYCRGIMGLRLLPSKIRKRCINFYSVDWAVNIQWNCAIVRFVKKKYLDCKYWLSRASQWVANCCGFVLSQVLKFGVGSRQLSSWGVQFFDNNSN